MGLAVTKINWEVLNIDGWMGDDELDWLYAQAKRMDSIVEIGSWQGRSTYALCLGCRGTVYAVDHFLGSAEHQEQIKNENLDVYAAFIKNMGHFKNLKVFRMTSLEASLLKEIPEKIDMVWIDGAHDYKSIKTDLDVWGHRAMKLLCGHDRMQDGVPDALKEYFKGDPFDTGGGIWCRENLPKWERASGEPYIKQEINPGE